MAIDPLGTPQPVKLAILPLTAARQAVRLTSEQNQLLREARLTADEKVQDGRDAARAAADSKAANVKAADTKAVDARVAQQNASEARTATRNTNGAGDTIQATNDNVTATENRGDRLNIFA